MLFYHLHFKIQTCVHTLVHMECVCVRGGGVCVSITSSGKIPVNGGYFPNTKLGGWGSTEEKKYSYYILFEPLKFCTMGLNYLLNE